MEHISIYLSQLGFAGKEGYMRVQNFPLSLIGIAFAWLYVCLGALLVHDLN